MIKPVDEGGLGWVTLWGSVALFALLVVLVVCQAVQVGRQPLKPLRYPINRRTGEPQQPNGGVVASTPEPGAGDVGAASSPDRRVGSNERND